MSHRCTRCTRTFSRKKFLLDHLARKNPCRAGDKPPEKPYECLRCPAAFSRLDNLKRHQQEACRGPGSSLQLAEELAELSVEPAELSNAASSDPGPSARDELSIVSADIGGVSDMFEHCIYFGIPGPLLLAESAVNGQLIKFGESLDVHRRVTKEDMPAFQGFTVLDCIATVNPVLIEQRFKKMLDMQSRLIRCKTVKKKFRDTEVFAVQSQQEYVEMVQKCKRLAEDHELKVLGRAAFDAKYNR